MGFVTITKQEFENALPKHRSTGDPLWEYVGFIQDEHVYYVPLPRDKNTGVMIRSSIGQDGQNADVGENSIRAWLVEKDGQNHKPLGSKSQKWITRTSGWDKRLVAMIRTLLTWRFRAGDCPVCQKPKRIFVVKKPGANKGRPFAKCVEHAGFMWLDEKSNKAPFFVSPNTDTSIDDTMTDVTTDVAETKTEETTNLPTITEGTRPIVTTQYEPSRTPNKDQLDAITAPVQSAIRVLAGPGSGKCLAWGTPILLYNGNVKPVQEIVIGDLLMGPDSKPRTVLSLARGLDMMYEIIPTKGDSYTVNSAHILSLQVSGKRYGGTGTIVNIPVREYLSFSRRKQQHLKGWRTGVDFPYKNTPIEPYLVGLWLGDGHSNKTAFTTVEPETTAYLHQIATQYRLEIRQDKHRPIVYHLVKSGKHRNALRNALWKLNLLGNKHIPHCYKCNDRNTRLELLAGLIDSDGHLAGGYYEITQKRLALAQDILFLARSLGFAAYMKEKIVDETSYWRINIQGDISEIPIRLSRKKAPARRQIKDVLRTGIEVQEKGWGEYFGFEIDGDGLFLLGDFTVTHNTFVIEERVAFLIANGISPEKIAVVTLTRSMAEEMKERIAKRTPVIEDSQWITTIHALCFRILKAEGLMADVPKTYQLKKTIQEISEDVYPIADDRPGWEEVYGWITTAMYHGLVASDDLDFFVSRLGDLHGRRLHEIRRLMETKFKHERWITFPMMLLGVELRLERDTAFRTRWQQMFSHIIIDEGQDTNGQAMRILSIIAEPQKNLMIVGDTDQLLFRFAGATPETNLFAGFETRYPDGLTYKLTINYRSTREIVKTIKELIAFNYTDKHGPYEQRYIKDLRARDDAPEGDPVSFQFYATQETESHEIAKMIKDEMDNGRDPGDVFVGMRTRAQAAYLEGALLRSKIPYINANGGSFWQSKHVADVLAYYTLALEKDNQDAFRRVYNIASNWMQAPRGRNQGDYIPHRYLGKAFLSAADNNYRNANRAAAMRRGWRPGVDDLVMFVEGLADEMERCTPADAIAHIVEECYLRYLKADSGIKETDASDDGKVDDLEMVKDVAGQFQTHAEFVAYVREIVKAASQAEEKDWSGHVVLATIHKLKGLQRPWIIGMGLAEGTHAMFRTPCGFLPHTYSMTRPPQLGILPGNGMGRVEDERCCAYVLISRAQERCDLFGCGTGKAGWILEPSRFVYEAKLTETTDDPDVPDRLSGGTTEEPPQEPIDLSMSDAPEGYTHPILSRENPTTHTGVFDLTEEDVMKAWEVEQEDTHGYGQTFNSLEEFMARLRESNDLKRTLGIPDFSYCTYGFPYRGYNVDSVKRLVEFGRKLGQETRIWVNEESAILT